MHPKLQQLLDLIENKELYEENKNQQACSLIKAITSSNRNPEQWSEKVDFNEGDEVGATLLELAIRRKYTTIGIALLNAGANANTNPNKADRPGPLFLATYYDNTEMVIALLRAGADPNGVVPKYNSLVDTGETPLFWTIHKGYTATANALLEAKAEIEHQSLSGVTPLDKAIAYNKFPLVLLFLENNGRVRNIDILYKFLSKEDQYDPCVLKCYNIPLKKTESDETTTPMPIKDKEPIYLKKLNLLHSSYTKLFTYLMCLGTNVQFPNEIMQLMLEYGGSLFTPKDQVTPEIYYSNSPDKRYILSMNFFKPDTINPHLIQLKKNIVNQTTRAKPVFSETIEELDTALGVVAKSSCSLM